VACCRVTAPIAGGLSPSTISAHNEGVRLVLGLGLLTACGRLQFGEVDALDRPIPHLPPGPLWDGTGELLLEDSVIDTTALTIDGAAPLLGSFVALPQPGGPELAVLQADLLSIDRVRVIGTRPLVLVARETLVVGILLDASALGTRAGAGARLTGGGDDGVHTPSVCDSGGGGGGHATVGAAGGGNACVAAGPPGGAIAGDDAIIILAGGTPGGAGVSNACGLPGGGGGGGALQLTAGRSIQIGAGASVIAGGGGGEGGAECGDGDAGAGGGGGAGGAVYLDAPSIMIDGAVLAHGGGGGAGGNGLLQNGPVGVGNPGADGTSLTAAPGGTPPAPNAGAGGDGGTGTMPPSSSLPVEHNAGGGGGAAGRIVVRGSHAGSGTISPAPRAVAP